MDCQVPVQMGSQWRRRLSDDNSSHGIESVSVHSKGTVMVRWAASLWAPHLHQYLLICSWATMKEFGPNNMMALQFISTADDLLCV